MPVDRWTTSCRLRAAAALAACSALAATEAGAHAAAPTLVSLEYELPPGIEGCPDAEQFRASIGRQLGYDPFRATAEKRVAVQIARREIGFDGRIRWSDAEGHWVGDRRLSSRHTECTEIAASLAFSVAVQIQLLAVLAPSTTADPNAAPAPENASQPAAAASPETSVKPREERPAETAPVEVAAPAPSPAPASELQLSIGVGPAVAIAVAPHTAGLGRLFASGRLGHFSLEIGGDATLPVNQYDSGGRGFTLDRFAVEAAACGHIAAFAACVTGTAGRMQAHGFGVDQQETPDAWFSQLGGRLAATYGFSDRYFAAARVDGLVMTAPVKVILNDTLVWTTPRVGAVLGFDLGARFF